MLTFIQDLTLHRNTSLMREMFTFYMISKYMNISYVSGGTYKCTNKQKLNKQIYQEDACSGRKYALVLNKALSIGPWGLLCTISGQ